jgi:hypothetical protein
MSPNETLEDQPAESVTDASDDRTVDRIHQRIETSLRDDLDGQWDQVLANWEEGAPSQKKAVRAYVSGLRNRALRSLLEIDTRDELERAVAIQYIELKCHWTMLNTRIQNQTAQTGQPDQNLLYRATCVSLIIQGLEPILSQNRVDRLTNFLSEPFDD